MRMTKVFKSGNSWAVRIPQEFQINEGEVAIFKNGQDLIIRKPEKNLAKAFQVLSNLPLDIFPKKRKDTRPQSRDFFE